MCCYATLLYTCGVFYTLDIVAIVGLGACPCAFHSPCKRRLEEVAEAEVPAAAFRVHWAMCLAYDAACLPFGMVGEPRRKLSPITILVLLLSMGVDLMDIRVSTEFPSLRQRAAFQSDQPSETIGRWPRWPCFRPLVTPPPCHTKLLSVTRRVWREGPAWFPRTFLRLHFGYTIVFRRRVAP